MPASQGPWAYINDRFIVTANPDGTPHLNSRIVAEFSRDTPIRLIDACIMAASVSLLDALRKLLDPDPNPAVADIQREQARKLVDRLAGY